MRTGEYFSSHRNFLRENSIWKHTLFLLLFVALLALPACGSTGGENPVETETEAETDGSVLTFAILNPLENRTKFLVNSFNSSHEDVQIEVWDYSDENGVQRLLLDLVAGNIPNVMELHQY